VHEADIDIRTIGDHIAEYFFNAAGKSEPDSHGIGDIVDGLASGRDLSKHELPHIQH
jgi:hypothetical protein